MTSGQFIPYDPPPLSTFFVKNKGGGHTELLSTKFFEIHYCFHTTLFLPLYCLKLNYTTLSGKASGKEIPIGNFLIGNFKTPHRGGKASGKKKAWTNGGHMIKHIVQHYHSTNATLG